MRPWCSQHACHPQECSYRHQITQPPDSNRETGICIDCLVAIYKTKSGLWVHNCTADQLTKASRDHGLKINHPARISTVSSH